MTDAHTSRAGEPPGDPGRQPPGDPPAHGNPQPDPGPPPVTDPVAPLDPRRMARSARNNSVEARRLNLTEAGMAT